MARQAELPGGTRRPVALRLTGCARHVYSERRCTEQSAAVWRTRESEVTIAHVEQERSRTTGAPGLMASQARQLWTDPEHARVASGFFVPVGKTDRNVRQHLNKSRVEQSGTCLFSSEEEGEGSVDL